MHATFEEIILKVWSVKDTLSRGRFFGGIWSVESVPIHNIFFSLHARQRQLLRSAMEAEASSEDCSEDGSDVDSDAAAGHASSSASADGDEYVGCESRAGSGDEHMDAAEDDGDDEAIGAGAVEQGAACDGSCDGATAPPSCSLCLTPLEKSNLHTGSEDCLACDGGCGRELPVSELRVLCTNGCDFDCCTACAGIDRRAALAAAAAAVAGAVAGASVQAPSRAQCVEPLEQRAPTSVPRQVHPMVAAAIERLAARRREQQRERRASMPNMAGFLAWQAERAAAVRRANGADSRDDSEQIPTAPTLARWGAADVHIQPPANDAAAVGSAATPATGYQLPAPPQFPPPAASRAELRDQVAALLTGDDESRRRAVDFAREVFRQLPTSSLHAAGDAELGRPDLADGTEGDDDDGSGVFAPVAAARVVRFQVGIPTARPALPPGAFTYQPPCLCCSETAGNGASRDCAALQLLATLHEEMAKRDEIIDQELDDEDGAQLGDLHRAARKFMYRTFVAAKYGHLGQGNRVKIPDCVIAAIRARYRAPGCECEGLALANCAAHGYTGFRAH